jgi:hypothetical protein
MADPWSLSVAAIALLGQVPGYFENWQKFLKKWRENSSFTKEDVDETEISVLQTKSDWLLHKIMLLDLILAFSKEHNMRTEVIDFCKSERPVVFEEYKQIKGRLIEFANKNKEN